MMKNKQELINFSPVSKDRKERSIHDYDKINEFIRCMNRKLSQKDYHTICLNTGLDHIEMLNDSEFKIAQEQAKKMGYELTSFEDNYNTISYKLSVIND